MFARLNQTVLLVLFLLVVFVIGACARSSEGDEAGVGAPEQAGVDQRTGIRVMTSFYPLYYFVREIGGERVTVTSLISAGADPHDWEPSVSDIKALNDVDLFIFNGVGFEPWVESVLESLSNESLVVVDSSQGLDLIRVGDLEHEHDEHGHSYEGHEHGDDEEHHGGAEEDHHHHGEFDPHSWSIGAFGAPKGIF